ncbi:NAC domain-containing protein 90-like isoform X2 [Diospyros lotus]|uniref:NAC domain-containing protein 90-like isoform X2 n=1 Tax=Diospyros lotus TaxID=55363 RepID=UPI002255E2D6|nr:NAC domain-containing protein 90-like isoform X2 [Diospyros lotus]
MDNWLGLAPGFRFYPTEEELLLFYLPKKIEGKRRDLELVIPVLYIYQFNPWDLPQHAGDLCGKDTEPWFFFIPGQDHHQHRQDHHDHDHAERESGRAPGRQNRLTASGYWKATGNVGYVYSSSSSSSSIMSNVVRIIGEKRTMVFYMGRAPCGIKTKWKMNEYRAIDQQASTTTGSTATPKLRREFSLCRLYTKSKSSHAYERRPPGAAATPKVVPRQLPYGATTSHHDHQNVSEMDQRTALLQERENNYSEINHYCLTTTAAGLVLSDHHHHGHWNMASDNIDAMGDLKHLDWLLGEDQELKNNSWLY